MGEHRARCTHGAYIGVVPRAHIAGVPGRDCERLRGVAIGPGSYPPACENNALVRTTRGAVAATFGTVEFGGCLLWLCTNTKFFL